MKNSKFILKILMVSLLLVIFINQITKPISLSYTEAIKYVQVKDNILTISFTEQVADYDTSDGLMAWQTLFNKIFKNSKPEDIVINLEENKNISISYVDQKGGLNRELYSSTTETPRKSYDDFGNGGEVTLPRLALNYNVFIAGVLALVLWIISNLFKKFTKIYKFLNIVNFIPLSYIIGSICILGLSGSTHHIIRDLGFVTVASILIFSSILSVKYSDRVI